MIVPGSAAQGCLKHCELSGSAQQKFLQICCTAKFVGDRPNTLLESKVSNTELCEFFQMALPFGTKR